MASEPETRPVVSAEELAEDRRKVADIRAQLRNDLDAGVLDEEIAAILQSIAN